MTGPYGALEPWRSGIGDRRRVSRCRRAGAHADLIGDAYLIGIDKTGRSAGHYIARLR